MSSLQKTDNKVVNIMEPSFYFNTKEKVLGKSKIAIPEIKTKQDRFNKLETGINVTTIVGSFSALGVISILFLLYGNQKPLISDEFTTIAIILASLSVLMFLVGLAIYLYAEEIKKKIKSLSKNKYEDVLKVEKDLNKANRCPQYEASVQAFDENIAVQLKAYYPLYGIGEKLHHSILKEFDLEDIVYDPWEMPMKNERGKRTSLKINDQVIKHRFFDSEKEIEAGEFKVELEELADELNYYARVKFLEKADQKSENKNFARRIG